MKITELNLYPIKSMRGSSVPEALIGSEGLENDRCWMLVDAEGKKITQRECPRLSLLVPRVEEGCLRVEVPGSSDIVVALNPASWTNHLLTVDLWGHEHRGIVADETTNRALSEATSMSCRLLWLAHAALGGNETPFHDDAPLLVISQTSLDELNRRLPEAIPMNRFRPSAVLTGSDPFEEDDWQRISIGETEFEAVKLCVRCAITTVDQARGEFRGPEPLKTLATFRRLEQNVAFGAYFRPLRAGATLRVGDKITVVDRKAVSNSVGRGA